MPGVLDAQVHIGTETTYGTAVTPTRSFEPYADNARHEISFLESAGMRAQMETIRSDRRRTVTQGGSDSIELDVQDKGLGMLLQAMLADSTINQQGVAGAYLQVHSSTHEESSTPLTVQWGKPPITSAAVQPFTFTGGAVKTWEIAQDVDDLLKVTLDLDYRDSTTGTALASAAYPASTRPYGWDDAAFLVNSTSVDVSSFRLSYDSMLDIDRRFMAGTVLKSRPVRAGIPVISGELGVEFRDLTEYNAWIAGSVIPIVATWTGGTADGTYSMLFKVTLAAVQYDGDANPVVSLSDLPRQPLPFKVLDNGTDAAVKIEYQSTDTAF